MRAAICATVNVGSAGVAAGAGATGALGVGPTGALGAGSPGSSQTKEGESSRVLTPRL